MATTAYTINTTEWTKVTDPGESGTCWKKTGSPILIDHTNQSTAGTLPTSTDLVTKAKSKRVPLDEDSDNVLGIPADDAADIYYAIAIEKDSQQLVVDAL